jgi:hypothetical protein
MFCGLLLSSRGDISSCFDMHGGQFHLPGHPQQVVPSYPSPWVCGPRAWISDSSDAARGMEMNAPQ